MAGMFLVENPTSQHGVTSQKTGAFISTHCTPQKTSRPLSTPKKISRTSTGSGGTGGANSGAVMSSTPPAKRAHTQAHAHCHPHTDVSSPSLTSKRPPSSMNGADRMRSQNQIQGKVQGKGQGQGQHTVDRQPGATLLPASVHAKDIISLPQKAHTIGIRELHHTPTRKRNDNENETEIEIFSKMTSSVTDRQKLHHTATGTPTGSDGGASWTHRPQYTVSGKVTKAGDVSGEPRRFMGQMQIPGRDPSSIQSKRPYSAGSVRQRIHTPSPPLPPHLPAPLPLAQHSPSRVRRNKSLPTDPSVSVCGDEDRGGGRGRDVSMNIDTDVMGNLDGDICRLLKHQPQPQPQLVLQHDCMVTEHSVYATPSKSRSTPTRDSRKHTATPTRTRTPTPTPTRYTTYPVMKREGREEGQNRRGNRIDNLSGLERRDERVDGKREREEMHHNRYGTPPTRRHPHPIAHAHAHPVPPPVSVSPAKAQHAPTTFSSPSPSRTMPRSQSASRAQSLAMQILSKPITPYQTPVKGGSHLTPSKSPGPVNMTRSPIVKHTGTTSAPSSHTKTPQARHSRGIGIESPLRIKSAPPLPLILPPPDLHPPPPPSTPYSANRMNISPFPFTAPWPTAPTAKHTGDFNERDDSTYSTHVAYVQRDSKHQKGQLHREHVGQTDSTSSRVVMQCEIGASSVRASEETQGDHHSLIPFSSSPSHLFFSLLSSPSPSHYTAFIEGDSAFMSLSDIASPSEDLDKSQSTSTWGMGLSMGLVTGLGRALGPSFGPGVGSGEATM